MDWVLLAASTFSLEFVVGMSNEFITHETDEMVCSNPQNVPKRPKKTNKPIKIINVVW